LLTESEIFSFAKKAARGAGFSWGMAEEAAMATLNLYKSGYDGFLELISILENADGKKTSIRYKCTGSMWINIGHLLFRLL